MTDELKRQRPRVVAGDIEGHSKQGASPQSPGSGRVLRSEEILQGSREVAIEHAGQFYRLRLTSTGKLILTK